MRTKEDIEKQLVAVQNAIIAYEEGRYEGGRFVLYSRSYLEGLRTALIWVLNGHKANLDGIDGELI